eukprot:scaffold166348_cov14-Tisochrysis_lutea.AAC.1
MSMVYMMTSYPHILNLLKRGGLVAYRQAGLEHACLIVASNYKLVITTGHSVGDYGQPIFVGYNRQHASRSDHFLLRNVLFLLVSHTTMTSPLNMDRSALSDLLDASNRSTSHIDKCMFPTTTPNFLLPGHLEGYYSRWRPDRATTSAEHFANNNEMHHKFCNHL